MIICWDYDGTLVSSEQIYKNIFVNYLKANNLVLKDINDKDYFKKYAGKHPFNVIKIMKKDGYIKEDAFINLDELKRVFENELSGNELILTKDIAYILNEISKFDNIFMAIVTSTYRADFEAKYNNPAVKILKNYFDINENIYICNEVGNKELKPSPNGYIFAYNDITKKYKLNPENNPLIMVEDSISGCKSACSAKNILENNVNCLVVGYLVGSRFCSKEELKEAGADVIVETKDEMLKFISEQIKNKI